MAFAWQNSPFGVQRRGTWITPGPPPGPVLFCEPADRRMRAELAGCTLADSDDAVILHETARYPVAYFPREHVRSDLLVDSNHTTRSEHLGVARHWTIRMAERTAVNGAWSYEQPPEAAAPLAGRMAFAWRAIDRWFEEDEEILGHAADPYHRIDIRNSRRHVVVRAGSVVIADTTRSLLVLESGFAPRFYVQAHDIREGPLIEQSTRTFCPYKGVAHYYTVATGTERLAAAAWAYPDPLPESSRLRGHVSFDAEVVDVEVDGKPLRPRAGQTVDPQGTDHDLTWTTE